MTTPLEQKDWKEKMETEAKKLSECADVMPGNLETHRSRIYNACLDIIYLTEKEISAAFLAGERKGRESMLKNVGMLRQWLNEDKIGDPNKLITNEDIIYWLSLSSENTKV